MPRVALTIWGSRISPVFETARRVRVVDVHGRRMIPVGDVDLLDHPQARIECLREHQVQVVICGALSHLDGSMLRAAGIGLVPFVTGEVDQVLQAYVFGSLQSGKYAMPGCQRRHRRRQRRGRG